MKLKPIYFDYMATTPVDPRVAEAMAQCLQLDGVFGNPASHSHIFGWQATEKVEQARSQIAKLINADSKEIVFTSGATEADNLAIIGGAQMYQRKGKHIITMSTEHKAVLDSCHYLQSQGFEVSYLNPQANGLLAIEQLNQALREDTILVTVMLVNNETGVIQDIAAMGELLKDRGVLFHVDGAQAVGKIPVDVKALQVSTLAISAHKMYGPKGIGALYVRRSPRVRLQPQIHGGGHESGLRSGTLATHQIVGFGVAATIALEEMQKHSQHLQTLSKLCWQKLSKVKHLHLNGDLMHRFPGCFNFRIDDIDRELLLLKLPHIAVSTGSACSSDNPEPSHVLTAMGLTRLQANQSIRFSFGRFTEQAQLIQALEDISKAINHIRSNPDTWQKTQKKIMDDLNNEQKN